MRKLLGDSQNHCGLDVCPSPAPEIKCPVCEVVDNRDYKELYYELIMEVAYKWPGETRHETEKRYIVECETPNPNACASSQNEIAK